MQAISNSLSCPPKKFGYWTAYPNMVRMTKLTFVFLIVAVFQANATDITSKTRTPNRSSFVSAVLPGQPVRGQVISGESKEPIIAASIGVKGSQQGTISDGSGEFSLSDVPDGATLVISSLGYQAVEVSLSAIDGLQQGSSLEIGETIVRKNPSGNIVLELKPSFTTLNEAVVIGYGTMKKGDLTGSISSIDGESVAERNTTNVSEALQGSIPGVMVTRDNAAPGSSATIRIRGITTIGDNTPLVLVDGVPVSDIDDVNPNDIESMTVLKDAASASIYGSRAAAGVILITTKRAKEGQFSLDLTYNKSLVTPTKMPRYGDAVDYMNMVNELRWNDIKNPEGGEYAVYDKNLIDNYADLHAENPDKYPDTKWMDLLLKDQVNRDDYQLNISGGGKNIQSRISLGYVSSDGLYMGKGYKRFTVRANNNIVINKKLSAFLDFNVKRALVHNPSESPMTNVYRSAPIYAAIWTNGLVADGKSGNNMYAQLLEGGERKTWLDQVAGRAGIEFRPLEGLKLQAIVAPEFNVKKEKDFRKKVQYTNYDDPNVYVGTTDWGGTTSLTENRTDWHQITGQLLANYDRSFGDHHLSLMGGYEVFYFFKESLEASSDNMTLDAYPYLDLGNPNFLKNSGSAYENAYMSYLGRAAYSFKDKYLLQGNIRFDGSSRFYKDYRWGAFPSFSAGWVISKEPFMASLHKISFLKLRASWGMLGNERIGNYPYQSTITFDNTLLYEGSQIVSAQTAAQYAYAIQDISWETTTSYNLGLDMNLFNDRLTFTGDVYKKTTRDMLLELEIPDYMGYSNPEQNTGKMYTNGWEIAAGWRDAVGDLKYSVSVNLSDFKSVMGDLGGIQFLGDQVKVKGSQFDEWYGYEAVGLYQTEDEVKNSAALVSGVRPGDVRYKDISGPDGMPDGIISEYDKVLLGGSLPRYLYGGNISLGYKNFDFSLAFQGVGKQNSRITANMVQPYQGSWGNIPLEIQGKYWSAYNTAEQNLHAVYPRLTNNFTSNNYAMSDYWLFNGGYFRLKNVVLGYTLPQGISKKLFLQSCRIYTSISDLFSLNKYPHGWDPEVANTGYPITTAYNFGISVKF